MPEAGAEITLLPGKPRRPPLGSPASQACPGRSTRCHMMPPAARVPTGPGCLPLLQEVHLKYTSRDGLLAALNLFRALQPEQQLRNSKGGHGERRTNAFVIFRTELRIKERSKEELEEAGLAQALGLGAQRLWLWDVTEAHLAAPSPTCRPPWHSGQTPSVRFPEQFVHPDGELRTGNSGRSGHAWGWSHRAGSATDRETWSGCSPRLNLIPFPTEWQDTAPGGVPCRAPGRPSLEW